ncbi:outer membrane protein transport protein [Thaumasiovibrio subtropicus]|uniref:outer membrane protein transport protein n=1 Tax=Thaumasiovibrio subtropicus TaxID=1891207 RepID=UPI000B35BAB9|nr:outer membrane protein transport protein [Thaumasiovibrio subtropicus]
MNKKRLLSQAIVAALAMSSTSALAAGFQLNAQSATGLGRAFAGDAVIADNASTIARNPAAAALFDQKEMSLGFTVIDTDVNVTNGSCSGMLCPREDGSGHLPGPIKSISDQNDIGSTAFVPNFYFVAPINEQWSWGVSAYSNFGTGTEFSEDFEIGLLGGKTDVMSMNFGGVVAYRINEQWSFGGGLDIIYGQGELMRPGALNADADGIAVGFNLGTTFELNENHRFGLSYRYSPTVKAKGDVTKVGVTAHDDTLHLALPDMVEFSAYHKVAEQFAVHYSAQWVGWSSFESVDSDAFGSLKTYEWKDAGHISLGGTYYLNSNWTLRAGYMYDIAAVDERTSLSIPDSDRQWFSAGASYHINSNSSVDFGITMLRGKDELVTEEIIEGMPIGGTITATTRADALLFGLQYSRKF